MNIVKINDDVFFQASELTAVEKEEIWRNSSSPSGNSYKTGEGSRIILRTGNKIFVKDVTPKEIMAKVQEAIMGKGPYEFLKKADEILPKIITVSSSAIEHPDDDYQKILNLANELMASNMRIHR